jgi:type I restriction enzyme R subunit
MPLDRIIDRAYQIEAVKTIAERIEAGKRHFLMVLATGTSKTRVAVDLVELLQRQERIQGFGVRSCFLVCPDEMLSWSIG